MALKKTVKKPNGVEVSYHRIAMVKIDVNQQITILVESYINEAGRNFEKDYAAGKIQGSPVFPYTDADYITLEYDDTMTVEKAYKWLKQQPEYIGAIDV